MALKREEIFQKEPSKEESTYHAAVSLMDAVDCVERFEREVSALRDAAALFESLGDYQDAKQRRKDCLGRADEAEVEGCRKTFNVGMKKKEKASTKTDYVDAIEEFRRLRKYEPYQDKIKQEIRECKQQIKRIETLNAYKRRAVALLVLALICLGLSQTPVFPVAKGVVHYFRGEYRAALNCYQAAEHLPGVSRLRRSAYYKVAEKAAEKGQDKKAMKCYREAWTYSDAPDKTARLEKKIIEKAEVGDAVIFGPRHWTVLSRDGDAVLLLSQRTIVDKMFDKDGKSWEKSTIRQWLCASVSNGSYLKQEQEMMLPMDDENQDDMQEYVFLLSQEEYLKYQSLIPLTEKAWWLRDNVIERKHAKCVSEDQILTVPSDLENGVRLAVWISVK